MPKTRADNDELLGLWCRWWDLPCGELAQYERNGCKEAGLTCSPEECKFCLAGYAAAEAAAEAEA